ncbi:unnamed protein product [Discula destructiva]
MWKLTIPSFLAATAPLASAQAYNTSATFTLQVTTTANNTINGQYLAAYHAGAAIEVLALDGKDGAPADYNFFNLNTSSSGQGDEVFETGILVYLLQGSGFNVSEGLVFTPSLTSNVVTPQFYPSQSSDSVGFDDEDKLFIHSSYYNERNFTAGAYPTEVARVPLYQWHACYTYTGSYYYQTLSWVVEGTPINPTCVPVNVTRTFL